MKWIVLAIVVCVIPYTWITLQHRKPGPAYLPYADNKSRAEVLRLLDAGYRRVEVPLGQSQATGGAALPDPAPLSPRPGGLPPLLNEVLIDKPVLPAAIRLVVAPSTGASGSDIVIHFTYALPEDQQHLARAILFAREQEITLVPVVGPLHQKDAGRTRDTTSTITIPAGTLKAGDYRFTLLSEQTSPSWRVTLTENHP